MTYTTADSFTIRYVRPTRFERASPSGFSPHWRSIVQDFYGEIQKPMLIVSEWGSVESNHPAKRLAFPDDFNPMLRLFVAVNNTSDEPRCACLLT